MREVCGKLGQRTGSKNGLIMCRPIVRIDREGNLVRYKSAVEAARMNGLIRRSIVNALTRNNNRFSGYAWEYEDKYE